MTFASFLERLQREDLAALARPGHGVPSQDPDPAAQFAIEPAHARTEQRSIFVGGGLIAGAALGVGIGLAGAGPAGVLVGGLLGALAGLAGGLAAGTRRLERVAGAP